MYVFLQLAIYEDRFEINYSLVNVVFESNEDASNALNKLSLHQNKEYPVSEERIAQDFGKPEINLTLRMSNLSDKKVKNAAVYSRYYLYNPPKHERERTRKPRRRRDSRSRSSGDDRYREREPVVFKRSVGTDNDDDGEDLFPEKAPQSKKEIRTKEGDEGDHDSSMIIDDNPNEIKIEREIQGGDLFERIAQKENDEESRPKTASLLERIGQVSNFKEKNLDKDDLFG